MGASTEDQMALQATHCCNGNMHCLRFTMAPAFVGVDSVFSM